MVKLSHSSSLAREVSGFFFSLTDMWAHVSAKQNEILSPSVDSAKANVRVYHCVIHKSLVSDYVSFYMTVIGNQNLKFK